MIIELEVRSTGPGPRERHVVVLPGGDLAPGLAVVDVMGRRWTRMATDHRGRHRMCADGVGVIIQQREPV